MRPRNQKPGESKKTKENRAEASLVGRAVKDRWPIPKEKRPKLVGRMLEIAATKGEGAVQNALRAAQVLVQMDGLNQADQFAASKVERLDAGKVTERVGQEPLIIERPI